MFMASKGVHSGPHLQTQCSTAISHNWVWFITTRNCWFSAMVHDWTSIVNELVTFISAVSYPLWAPQYFTRTHRVLGKNPWFGRLVVLPNSTQNRMFYHVLPASKSQNDDSYILYILHYSTYTWCFFCTSSPRNLPRSDPWQPGFLYYTSNSGYLASGSLTRLGDRHVMQSILSNDCALELEMWWLGILESQLGEAEKNGGIQWISSWLLMLYGYIIII